MRHTLSIISILALIWVANSGYWQPLILCFGLFSILFVAWISHRMDVVDHESQPVHLTTRIPGYYLWLLKQIFDANIDVVRRVWSFKPVTTSALVNLPVAQTTDMGRVIYANSINLTPGTLVVELSDNEMLVHSLTQKNIETLQSGEMSRRVCDIE